MSGVPCWVCDKGPRQGGWALCVECEAAWLKAPHSGSSRDVDFGLWVAQAKNARIKELEDEKMSTFRMCYEATAGLRVKVETLAAAFNALRASGCWAADAADECPICVAAVDVLDKEGPGPVPALYERIDKLRTALEAEETGNEMGRIHHTELIGAKVLIEGLVKDLEFRGEHVVLECADEGPLVPAPELQEKWDASVKHIEAAKEWLLEHT